MSDLQYRLTWIVLIFAFAAVITCLVLAMIGYSRNSTLIKPNECICDCCIMEDSQ